MKQRELTSEVQVGRAVEEVFEFFSDASNLDAITPSWLEFRILTPTPIRMGVGTMIDYALKVRGVPIKWRSEITIWQPPYRFVDEQRRRNFCCTRDRSHKQQCCHRQHFRW